ncbi:MAG: glutathione S-transferase family protein [Betaproteobacteria bacterium]|nr:glutathione S-transferase family protein [Betaproteobacteria bacterium]
MTLVIGNKNYSSWSLRPWLLLKQAGIPFREVRIPLYTPDSKVRMLAYAPTGKVPVLRDGDTTVWDSLAICEYLAESFPEARLWPTDRRARATARSLCAEMHSGFSALRSRLPMNIRRAPSGVAMDAAVQHDVARVLESWSGCLAGASQGGFLFGPFTIADAFFAPVVLRFHIYQVSVPEHVAAYAGRIMALPAMGEWLADARAETEAIAAFDAP